MNLLTRVFWQKNKFVKELVVHMLTKHEFYLHFPRGRQPITHCNDWHGTNEDLQYCAVSKSVFPLGWWKQGLKQNRAVNSCTQICRIKLLHCTWTFPNYCAGEKFLRWEFINLPAWYTWKVFTWPKTDGISTIRLSGCHEWEMYWRPRTN